MTRPKGARDRRPRRKPRVSPSIETVAERTRRLQLVRDEQQRAARAAIDGVDPDASNTASDPHPGGDPDAGDPPGDPPGGDPGAGDPHPKSPGVEAKGSNPEDPEPDDVYTYIYDPHLLKVNLTRGSRSYLNSAFPKHRGRGGLNEFDAESVADVVTPVVDKWTRRNAWWLPEIVAGFVLGGIALERILEPKGEHDGEDAKPAGAGRATAEPGGEG